MILSITPEQMADYREGYRRRTAQRAQMLTARHAPARRCSRNGSAPRG
jgi:hypothetical protein